MIRFIIALFALNIFVCYAIGYAVTNEAMQHILEHCASKQKGTKQ